ncbi:putative NADH-flavin reductase [Scopulibacillus darangshiensis]|uniref:Putative NADH-flavin reductase n=1 Tax=Scopulibacillus darangshiensis TaxID=442528 RepID=A0A4R2NIN0_9BACL|nr:NAD(P)H-binding protein [Scopulibacillus darangshiensis]TCP20964.1 putative NADH-flavin reductase [Scopulibacillus darangshiensis]
MNLLILGATGRVGREVVRLALEDQHNVTAFVRDPARLGLSHPKLHVLKGDATQASDLLSAVKGQHAVLGALSTDGGSTLSISMPLIVKAMEKEGVKRIVTIGTAGILNSRENPEIFRFQSNESRRIMTRAAEEHLKAFETLKKSSLQWTVVCPTYLPDGESEGRYRVEANMLPNRGERISVCDAASFAYNQLADESYLYRRVGIAY